MNDEEELIQEEELVQEEEILEEEVVQEDEVQEDEEVEKAKKYGHLSKEEWEAQGRDPKAWKSPEEYNKTGEIIEQLMSLRKQVERRDREIQALVDYQQRTSQREYEKAKKELEHGLKASKEDMDMEGVAHYTRELDRLQYQEQQNQVNQYQQVQQQAVQSFIERNQHWYNERNPDLKQRAHEIDNEIKERLPGVTPEQAAKMIETRIQYEFPERVLGQSKVRPEVSPSRSSVNKTAVNRSSASKVFQSLPQDLKDTYNAHKRIRQSLGEELTQEEFIERLKRDGEI